MKRKVLSAALMAILFIIAVSVTLAYADDCSIGRTPDGVYPIAEKDVVMVSEEIWVDVEKGFVECKFVFKNTGEKKDVLMGFPAKMEDNGDNTMEKNLYFKDFKTYLKGAEIPVNTEKGIKPVDLKDSTYPYYSEWYTFNVHFDAGETKNIRNTYRVDSTYYSTGDVLSGYILKTGAFWKDAIGYAKVTFDLGNIKPYEISRIFPFSMKYEGKNKLVWERSNFEPEFDLEIMYNAYRYNIEALQTIDSIDRDYLQTFIEEVHEFEKLDSKLDGMSEEELKNHFNKYAEDKKAGTAKYIQSKMPEDILKEKGPVIKELLVDQGTIRCISENENRDYTSARLKVTHTKNGMEAVDYNELLEVKHLSGESQISQGIYIDLLPNKKYDIEYSIKDSYGNMDVKKIKYPPDKEDQNDVNLQVTDKEIENGTDTVDVAFTNEKPEQEQYLPMITVVCAGVLVVVLLSAFILFRRRR